MKSILSTIAAVLAFNALALSQTYGRPQPSPSAAPAQATPVAPSSQPNNAPQETTADQPKAPRKVQAKTKPEYDAFQAASAPTDPAQAEAAANDFAAKFPDSDLRSVLYQQLLVKYRQANNTDKTLEVGRKVIALDPQSVLAMITVASTLAETSHDTDLNWQERHTEAVTDANKAVQLIDSGEFAPPQLSKPQLDSVKSMAYAAIGTMEFNAKNDAAAEPALRKAADLNTLNPEPSVWLRLAVALDHEKKYPEASNAANRAVALSANDPNVHVLAVQEQTRLKQLGSGTEAIPLKPSAPTPAAPGSVEATPHR